ncbi:MAG: hypothetical protein KJ697_02365 [Nanoarchaeota archaeon]|nr:hypothetical protein [Nanoarchaeota archaeon]MBU4123912.1 hypothetical protein [Nanoarchaeota archaeon]
MRKNKIIVISTIILFIILVIFLFYPFYISSGECTSEQCLKCIESGGIVTISLCCKSSSDFPRMDLIGACGCSPENSHEVKICDCGENAWNGKTCI